MSTNNYFLFKIWFVFLIVFISLIESCSYHAPIKDYVCKFITKTKQQELKDSIKTLVFEDPGTIIVIHGFGCAESNLNDDGMQDIIKVNGMQNIPLYATDAAVFLNGWHLKYLHSDHHVAGLGTAISNIQLNIKPDRSGKILSWQAAGIISDKNTDDPYSWCYFYTVVAWNSSNLSLIVDQQDGSCDPRDLSNAHFYFTENQKTSTALSSFESFLYKPEFRFDETAVIIPRGFGFEWQDGNEDHHLLQIGYNLDHSEKFIENGKKYLKGFGIERLHLADSADCVDSGFVSWETYAIYKDNDQRRNYHFGEIVSALGGNDLSIIQPPFSILPRDGINAGTVESGGIRTQDFTVKNIPFKYVIPMLTGWELGYLPDDQHVKEIGIWIDEIHYDFDSNTQKGTISYKLSSVLNDNDKSPDFYSRHKVTILGLKGTTGVKIQK
jgi:hypothetical protein